MIGILMIVGNIKGKKDIVCINKRINEDCLFLKDKYRVLNCGSKIVFKINKMERINSSSNMGY